MVGVNVCASQSISCEPYVWNQILESDAVLIRPCWLNLPHTMYHCSSIVVLRAGRVGGSIPWCLVTSALQTLSMPPLPFPLRSNTVTFRDFTHEFNLSIDEMAQGDPPRAVCGPFLSHIFYKVKYMDYSVLFYCQVQVYARIVGN